MSISLYAAVVVLLMRAAPDPAARAVLDTALAHMGGLPALSAVARVELQVMTEWQRTDFDARRAPVILSYELSTELRDYTIPAWRYSRKFYSPNGSAEVVDLVSDSVAAIEMNGRWRAQNVAYVDERDEVFAFAPERVVRLAHEAPDARTLPDTTIGGTRYARVSATVARFHPVLFFRRSDGLLALARVMVGQPNDFGLAPWGTMEVEFAYSRWQRLADAKLMLPMQIDVSRVGRPYKRMTTISAKINPVIPPDSLVVADSLRSAFLASSRRPMFDLPMDSARIVDGSFALFGAFGTPSGAMKLGGKWVLIEAGTAPLTIERSASFLRHADPSASIDAALVTAPTGAGGIAWLVQQSIATWVTDAAAPFADAALRGWPKGSTRPRVATGQRWIHVGSDSLRVERIDLPDYPGATVVYVPSLRWVYAWPAGPAQMEYVLAHIRERGWRADRVGSARSFVGTPIAPAGTAAIRD